YKPRLAAEHLEGSEVAGALRRTILWVYPTAKTLFSGVACWFGFDALS
ncbi:hypothetical protein DES42_1201, partial [Zavarzinia compransoris]